MLVQQIQCVTHSVIVSRVGGVGVAGRWGYILGEAVEMTGNDLTV